MTSKLALQWLPCQAPGVIGSVLGLVGLVSEYCDWVRWRVGSATSVSVWQHVKLCEQIRPWDTLACCWDIKQPANNSPMLEYGYEWQYETQFGGFSMLHFQEPIFGGFLQTLQFLPSLHQLMISVIYYTEKKNEVSALLV